MKRTTLIITITLIVLAFLFALIIYIDYRNNFFSNNLNKDNENKAEISETSETSKTTSQDCLELGCAGIYSGSINSDKFYYCNCSYARRILPENLICFSSFNSGLEDNRTYVEC